MKPARAGSSIGVTVAYGIADSLEKATNLISVVYKLSLKSLGHAMVETRIEFYISN